MLGFIGKVISNLLSLVVTIALLVGGCVFVLGTAAKQAQKNGGIDKMTDNLEKSFATGVADDLIEQYDIVKNGSDETAKSVRAGAVAEMFLQARDSSNYELWKSRADAHMKKALGQ
jgi:hypothetical protein